MSPQQNAPKPDPKTAASWKKHLKGEIDASFLYEAVAEIETSERKREVLSRMASIEKRHVDLLKKLLSENNISIGALKPSFRARLLVWVARNFGKNMVYWLMLREEGREVKGYLRLFKDSPAGSARETTHTLAKESVQHAEALRKITGTSGEPWHQTESGGLLRDIVYGFNDGLTANFGLVAGIIGAAVEPNIILISGLAGMVADSLSMGSSGYLAAKSEEEVYAHEISMEKEEIALMPELETEELALIYEAKGIEPKQAQQMAEDIMKDPERALKEEAREELGIGTSYATPLRQGIITGIATGIGAFIPVAPFIFLSGLPAVWVAFSIAMASHFGVGAARNIFTGRGFFRSGFDMFVVGFGVALVGYFFGDLIVRLFR